MELYHSEIRLPDGFVAPTHRVALRWTRHADQARMTDRYGEIRRFKSATLGRLSVVEVEVREGRISKILFRGRYNPDFDVCMALIPNGDQPWTVKTVWLNARTDSHTTLDRSRYVC